MNRLDLEHALTTGFSFAPQAPAWALWALGAAALLVFAVGMLRGRPLGALLRLAAFGALMLGLLGPRLVSEIRDPLSDIALLVMDESASQEIDGREARMAEARAAIEAQIGAMGDQSPIELRVATAPRAEMGDDRGTRLFSTLDAAAAQIDPARLAGVIVVTDGRAHDAEAAPASLPAPLHMLSTGRAGESDRRIALESAPTYAIVGESLPVRMRIEEFGAPAEATPVTAMVNGKVAVEALAAPGTDLTLLLPIDRGGRNVVELSVPERPGELTARNNRVAFTVEGARDRLRVLLVSGEPHAGGRAWRNILKSDPSVDLVHFTILRPPSKDAAAPIEELALIPFPTRELFLEKLEDFDLVIFDRYARRGVLAPAYLENMARYVREGGAALIAAGPEYAGGRSLYHSPLRDIALAEPIGTQTEAPYRPALTEIGRRHPVTAPLARLAPGESREGWGPWLRSIDVTPLRGDALLSGPEGAPVLMLGRIGDHDAGGRVAFLASDSAWLWSRGYQGGGPLAELLRRTAYWLMKEPELEEEALTADQAPGGLRVERRTMGTPPAQATAQAPSGDSLSAPFVAAGPGLWRALIKTREQGLFTVTDGELSALAALGPAAPREFDNPLSDETALAPLREATGGGLIRLIDTPAPRIRSIAPGARAYGRDWIGLERRGAYAVRDSRAAPLAPGWLMLLLCAALMIAAWRVESR